MKRVVKHAVSGLDQRYGAQPYGEGPVSSVTTNAVSRAGWSVLWIKGKKVYEFDCGTEFGEALELYTKAVKAERKMVTLKSKNVGHPPPTKYTAADRVKIVERKGKRKRVRVTVNIMDQINRQGWWWCPFCVKLRRFQYQKGQQSHLYDPPRFVERPGFYCPVCGIHHDDWHVQRHNPIAARVSYQFSRRRKGKGGKRRKRGT